MRFDGKSSYTVDYIPHPLEAFCESHPMLGCEKTVPWSILKLAEQNYYPSTLNGTSLSMCLTDLSDLRYCSYFRRASRNALSPGFLVLCVRPGTLQSRPRNVWEPGRSRSCVVRLCKKLCKSPSRTILDDDELASAQSTEVSLQNIDN